ncbi:MAG: PhzF family phenazine biosynthesis protein [bacterium]|nr:PhzF family phenazine biosynthesis protein [bacterium]
MAGQYEYAVVDVFADRPLTGNSAAVILDAAGLTDARMGEIAREFNLSETTIVLPPRIADAAVRFRWFTPQAEVDMCGHATLAGVHALVESGRFLALKDNAEAVLPIETVGGLLRTRMEPIAGRDGQHIVWLELRPPRLEPRSLNMDKLARLLGTTVEVFDKGLPLMQTQDDDVLVFVQDHQQLQALAPNFAELAAFQNRQGIRGFSVATVNTLTPSMHVQSRFFCPAVGIDEDPVTGSVHGPLAVYLVINELVPMRNHTAAVSCVQSAASGRAGLVRALVTQRPGRGYETSIAGQCITTMRGVLTI